MLRAPTSTVNILIRRKLIPFLSQNVHYFKFNRFLSEFFLLILGIKISLVVIDYLSIFNRKLEFIAFIKLAKLSKYQYLQFEKMIIIK